MIAASEKEDASDEYDARRPRTPDCVSWLLPPTAAADDPEQKLNKTRRTDGGMYYFVPLAKMVRVAALVATIGTVAGLALLAIVYFSSLVEGRTIESVNAASRALNAEINSKLGGASVPSQVQL